MSLNDIIGMQRKRKIMRSKACNDIFKKVSQRIKHYARFHQSGCEYDIPHIIYGVPHLDREELSSFLENKLQEEGFIVIRTSPTKIYISWEESIIKLAQDQKRERENRQKEHEEFLRLESKRNNEMLALLARK